MRAMPAGDRIGVGLNLEPLDTHCKYLSNNLILLKNICASQIRLAHQHTDILEAGKVNRFCRTG